MIALSTDRKKNSAPKSGARWDGISDNRVAADVRRLLADLGQDTTRHGLAQTPERVARMYGELLAGYTMDVHALINGALFPTDYRGIVLVRDIEFYSLCEHHLLPFFGRAHVAYLPDKYAVGLSKIPRIVEMFGRRLQLQEQLTQQIAECVAEVTGARGAAVEIEAVHMCAAMRGVNQRNMRMVTRTYLGAFEENAALQAELAARLQ